MPTKPSSRSPLRALIPWMTWLLLVGSSGGAGAQVFLDVLADQTEVPPGSSVTIEVVASGLGDSEAPSLGAFDVQLTFDPDLFALVDAVSGLELGDPALGEVIAVSTVGAAEVASLEISLLPPADLLANQGDLVTLFFVTFDAIGPGTGLFDLVLEAPLADELGNPIDVAAITPTTVGVPSPVEIPTLDTLGILVLALFLAVSGSFVMRRRSRSTQNGVALFLVLMLVAAPLIAMPGDIDGDGDVDLDDIDLILEANGSTVGAGDARDLDGDGAITVLDMRQAAVVCSRPLCVRNAAPAITPPADQTTQEDTATGALAFTAEDADDDPLTLTLASSDPVLIPETNLTLGGSQPNFTLDVLPAPDQNGGPVTLTITADDGFTTTDATFLVTVDPVNDPPTITTGASFAIPENTTAVTDVESTDLEGDSEGAGLTYSLTGTLDDALFTLDADTGVLAFLTPPDFEMPGDVGGDNLYDLEVTVTDSGGLTDVQALTVAVTGVNKCPIVVDDALANDEDTVLNGDVFASNPTTADSDPEGDTLTVTAVNGNPANVGVQIPLGNGLLTVQANGTTSFDPNGGYEDLTDGSSAQEVFTYTVDDGSATCAEPATVTLTIDGINDAPTITTGSAFSVAEGQVAVTDVESADVEGDTEGAGLTYNLTGSVDDALFSLDPATGVLAFLAAPDFETPGDVGGDNVYNLEVTVTDSGAETDVQSVTVTVTGVNECPTAVDDALLTDEDTVLAGNVLAANPTTADSDPEGDTLTVAAVNGNAASVGVQIPLGGGLLTVSANGTLSFDPNGGYESLTDGASDQESFTYTLDDGSGTCAEVATVTLTIDGLNDAPVITTGNAFSVAEGQTAVTDVQSSDPEGDTEGSGLSYSLTGTVDDALFTLDANTGVLAFLAAPDFEAPGDVGGDNVYNLEITVTDSGSETDVQSVTVTVTGVNECPAPVDDALATDEDTVLVGNVLAANPTTADSDPEGDALTVTAVNGNAANVGVQIPLGDGLLTVNANGSLSFDPDGGYDSLSAGMSTQEVFTYTVDDGSGTCAETATVTLTINGINDIPMFTSDGGGATAVLTVAENQTAVTDVQSTDAEGDTEGSGLTYSISGGGDQAFFVLDPVTGVLNLSTPLDFEKLEDVDGDDLFEVEVTVTDSVGASNAQMLTITIGDANDPPSLGAGALTFVDDVVHVFGGSEEVFNAQVVTVSQDGRFVYTGADDVLTVWERDQATGEVVVLQTFGDASGIDGLESPGDIVLSPDSRHLYMTSRLDQGLVVFARDVTTGLLTFVEVFLDSSGALPPLTLQGADALAVSPDGLNVYVGSESGRRLAVFSRDGLTGRLTLVEVLLDGVDAPGIFHVNGIVVSPDGNHVYTAARLDNAVTVFDRDPATGQLTFVEEFRDDVGSVTTLDAVVKVVLSCDGKSLYAVAVDDDAITVFSRDDNEASATYGQLTFLQSLRDGMGAVDGLGGVDGLDRVEDVRVTDDGRHVFTAAGLASEDNAVASFARDPATGLLTYLGLLSDGTNGADHLETVLQLAISPDDRHLYAVAIGDDALTVLSRETSQVAFDVAGGPVNLLPTATDLIVDDQDDPELTLVEVTLTNLLDAGLEVLAAAPSGAIGAGDINYVAPTLSIAPAGGAPLADFEAVLASLTYDNTAILPDFSDRILEITANDGTDTSNTYTLRVVVENSPPEITSDGAGDTAAILVATGNAAVTDVQSTDPEGEVEGAFLMYSLTDSDGAGPLGADNALFTLVPATGVLTFTAAPDFSSPLDSDGDNDYEVEVTVTDSGGGTDVQSITVTVFNPPPVGGADSFDFVGNTLLLVDRPTSGGPEILVTTGSIAGVLDNDSDPNDAISVSGVFAGMTACLDGVAPFGDGPTCPTVNGGTVVVESNGQFRYTPLAGDTAAEDRFGYRLTDGTTTVDVVVTLTRQSRVWYVENDNASGTDDGTSGDPFDTLAEAEAASSAGDTIYVFEGDGTDTNLDAGISLLSGQRLLGEGVDLTVLETVNGVAGPTLFDSMDNNLPNLSQAGASAVTVDATSGDRTDVEIRGLLISDSDVGIDVLGGGTFETEVSIVDNHINRMDTNGIQVILEGSGTTGPTGRVLIDGNTSQRFDRFGIFATARIGAAELDVTLLNNLVNTPGPLALDGIRFESGSNTVGEASRVCLDTLDTVPPIGDNNTATTLAFDEGMELQQYAGSTFQLVGLATSDCSGIPCDGTNAQRVEEFLEDNNELFFLGSNVRTAGRIVNYIDAADCAEPSP